MGENKGPIPHLETTFKMGKSYSVGLISSFSIAVSWATSYDIEVRGMEVDWAEAREIIDRTHGYSA